MLPNGKTLATGCVDRGMFPFKTGDRVVFNNNENGYSIGRNNPIYGSPHFCCGVIHIDGGLRVQWDNGTANAYDQVDLDFAATYEKSILNPNLLFKFQKRYGK